YAKDRGCTAPGCDVTGYYCEVHHTIPYAQSHTTDINQLTLACGGHHPLAEQGYTTRTTTRGDTEWIPPPHLNHGQPRTNTYHHPENVLAQEDP
ncbi:HNH endonuclease signature motif containing protein, partial [Mycobacterium kubicae]|uniref:HNH endonuclease signature motif containing protein n=1 Tax=Mycobacterium kubicae TaxID=120959 RepID=UPI000A5FF1C5